MRLAPAKEAKAALTDGEQYILRRYGVMVAARMGTVSAARLRNLYVALVYPMNRQWRDRNFIQLDVRYFEGRYKPSAPPQGIRGRSRLERGFYDDTVPSFVTRGK